MLRRSIQIGLSLLGLYVVLSIAAGIYLAEAAIHPHRRPVSGRARYMAMVETYSNSGVEDVAVDTTYQVKLKGWYVQPKDWNHEAVILLHGVSDDREGVASYSVMFLKAGYAVLLPDSRAHGESGGAIATYGVMERYDVAAWAIWLHQRMHGCTYLFGESMGAAIALQAMTVSRGICAVVVESPFSTFREIARDRIAQYTGTGWVFSHIVGRPMLEAAFLYVQLRYDVNLTDAQPKKCVAVSKVPTLLIAGDADRNIAPKHAIAIMRTAPPHDVLWEVPNADHGGAVRVAGAAFESKVLGWFASHQIPAS
jgi:alpha-beta hydrolase superfamily lysophospholipase